MTHFRDTTEVKLFEDELTLVGKYSAWAKGWVETTVRWSQKGRGDAVAQQKYTIYFTLDANLFDEAELLAVVKATVDTVRAQLILLGGKVDMTICKEDNKGKDWEVWTTKELPPLDYTG